MSNTRGTWTGWGAWLGAIGIITLAACSGGDGLVPQVDAGGDVSSSKDARATVDSSKEDANAASDATDVADVTDVADSADAVALDAASDGGAGSACNTNADCSNGLYCEKGDNLTYSASAQTCGFAGVCTTLPPPCNPSCASDGDTFCGCDGTTYYCIDCVHSAGTDVAWINMQGLSPCP